MSRITMGPTGVAAYVYDDVVTSMQQGTVVMVIDGAPLAGRILDPAQSKVAGNLGFAVMPGGAAGPKPGFAAHGLCVVANSEEQEAAYKFVEWAMSFDTMKRISLDSPHVAVSRNSLWEDPDFIAKYDYNYGAGSFIKAYQDSLNAAPADHFPPFAAWPIISENNGASDTGSRNRCQDAGASAQRRQRPDDSVPGRRGLSSLSVYQ